VGVHLLKAEHAAAIERLASQSGETGQIGFVGFYPPSRPAEFVERSARERTEGEAYVHAVVDGSTLVGLCGLHHVDPLRSAELCVWIGSPYRGKGFASLATENMLSFAFGPLRLEQVYVKADESDAAAQRLLEKAGFVKRQAPGTQPEGTDASIARVAHYEITRASYQSAKLAPFLRELCRDLQPIVQAELAAGNEIGDCSRGWPEKNSVVIAFRKPFRAPTGPLPANVEYREINDTHWWKAEYASKSPVHLLTCGF
jgi:RimJ/RimL family protein N-acetyltransferase